MNPDNNSIKDRLITDASNRFKAFLNWFGDSDSRLVLRHLSLFGAPITLAAVFCQLFGMSIRDNAAVCLVVTYFLALFRYRSYINKQVTATWALLALGLFVSIYHFVRTDVARRDTGLVRFYSQANDYLGEALSNNIQSAKHEIFFVGTTFHITADGKRTKLLDALARGVDVRYLVIDKDCKELELIAPSLGTTAENLRADCNTCYKDLEKLMQDWNSIKDTVIDPGNLEVKYISTLPTFRGYFIDSETRGPAYIVPYISEIDSGESPGFLYANSQSVVASRYIASARRFWSKSPVVSFPAKP